MQDDDSDNAASTETPARHARTSPNFSEDIQATESEAAAPVKSKLTRLTTRTLNRVKEYEDRLNDEAGIELEQDLFSNAFVALLIADSQGSILDSVQNIVAVLMMLVVFFMQTLMANEIKRIVWSNYAVSDLEALQRALEIVVGTNNSMPVGLSEKICGAYDEREFSSGKLQMFDGTVYRASNNIPLYYYTKLPGASWKPSALGDERSVLDDMGYMTNEGVSMNPFGDGPGYSVLFVVVIFVWLCTILVEFRKVINFGSMIAHFHNFSPQGSSTTPIIYDEDTEKFRVVALTPGASWCGIVAAVSRTCVGIFVGWVGCLLLFYTKVKLDLIFNSLALVFILELDNILFAATISVLSQNFLSDIEPIRYQQRISKSVAKLQKSGLPIGVAVCCLMAALFIRYAQVEYCQGLLSQASALCLFGGPPPSGHSELAAPVVGLCESLLSVRCAPVIDGPGIDNGPCVISDQGIFHGPKVQLYINGSLYPGMSDSEGNRRPWIVWQDMPYETSSTLWSSNMYQSTLRKQCVQMYHPEGKVERRTLDRDKLEVANAAPFWCDREMIFSAVFSTTRESMRSMMVNAQDSYTFGGVKLSDHHVVDAVGRCRGRALAGDSRSFIARSRRTSRLRRSGGKRTITAPPAVWQVPYKLRHQQRLRLLATDDEPN